MLKGRYLKKKIPTCQNVRTIKELFPDDASGTMKNFYEKKFTKITALSYEKKYNANSFTKFFGLEIHLI